MNISSPDYFSCAQRNNSNGRKSKIYTNKKATKNGFFASDWNDSNHLKCWKVLSSQKCFELCSSSVTVIVLWLISDFLIGLMNEYVPNVLESKEMNQSKCSLGKFNKLWLSSIVIYRINRDQSQDKTNNADSILFTIPISIARVNRLNKTE